MKIPIWMLSGLGHTVELLASFCAKLGLTDCAGAPETFRPDDTADSFPVQVRPDVDIWSVGCVFSEAAVWSRFGWKRVLEYRNRRQDEVRGHLKLDGEYLFHDGHDVLETVQDIHEHIAKRARIIDYVTVEILRLLNDDMLLNENEPRYSAKQVFHKSRRVINATRKKFEAPEAEVSSREDEDNGNNSDSEERPKTPPSVPPGYVGGSGVSSRKPASTRVGTFSSARPISMNSARSYLPSLQSATASRQYHSRATNRNRQNQQNDNPFGPCRSDSIGLHDLPDPPSPATSYQSSPIDRFNALSINTQDLDHAQGHRRPHRETMGETSNRAGRIAPDKASLRRSRTEKTPSNHPRRDSSESFPGSFSEPPSPIQDSKLPTPPPSSSSNHHRPQSSLDADNQISPESKDQEHQEEPKRPLLSLNEGLSWKEKRKKGYLSSLNGQENLTYLNERDHVGFYHFNIHFRERSC